MTLRDELLILWILCAVVITFAARHFFGSMIYLVEQMAAFSVVHVLGLLHLLIGQLR